MEQWASDPDDQVEERFQSHERGLNDLEKRIEALEKKEKK